VSSIPVATVVADIAGDSVLPIPVAKVVVDTVVVDTGMAIVSRLG
jgi:hypothetical protein